MRHIGSNLDNCWTLQGLHRAEEKESSTIEGSRLPWRVSDDERRNAAAQNSIGFELSG